jgi:acyl dehydratase
VNEVTEAGIPDEIKAMIGTTTDPMIMEVERGAIRRFADAIDDPNPLYSDVEYAKNSRYGEMICPIGFFGWPLKGGGLEQMMGTIMPAMMKAGLFRILDGGVDYEFFIPIHAGDILTSVGKIADIREREGKSGKMMFIIMEQTYLNQNGDKVAIARATIIAR